MIKNDRGAVRVRSRRRLYRVCRLWERQHTSPNVQPAGLRSAPAAVLLSVRSVKPPDSSDIMAWGLSDLRSMARVASSKAADGKKIASWCRYCRLHRNQIKMKWTSAAVRVQNLRPQFKLPQLFVVFVQYFYRPAAADCEGHPPA
jgi:hypothetical protein